MTYRTSDLTTDFLNSQFHRFVHLRWALDDLRDFSRSSEELLERRHKEARDTDRFALSPFIVRGSILVMACAVVEAFLADFCILLSEHQGLVLLPDELRGSGIARARTYIKKVAGLPFPDHLWPTLRALLDVRNAIVHANGKVTDPGKRQSVLQALPFITIENKSEVWPEQSATERILDLFADFIDRLEADIVGPSSKQVITKRSGNNNGVADS